MRIDVRQHRPMTKTKMTTTRTGPSIPGAMADGVLENSAEEATTVTPPILVEEDLYAMPPELPPTYRPLDWLSQALVLGVMGNIALIWDATRQSQKIRNSFHLMFQKGPLVGLSEIMFECQRASWSTTWQWMKWLAGFLLRCAVLTTFTTMLLQDIFLRPARVSSAILKENFHLPSTLSKFESITVQGQNVSRSIGLHWLEDRNYYPTSKAEPKRILYCNHGFGASSLSWLPSLTRMTRQLKCQIALAHDALGFGFSEPPNELKDDYLYSSAGSANLAKSLLLERYGLGQNDTMVLVGHSMGALTTLRLALLLPKDIEKRIILVAPALGIRPPTKAATTRTVLAKPRKIAQKWFLERPFQYILRRAVGRPGFWRSGLKMVWGNAQRLKDTDVLRFQWPSIHRGWESGLVRFAKAQTKYFAQDESGGMPDEELLIRVLGSPNTKVEVILGGNDRVVAADRIRRFLEPFPDIPIQELEGLGHDPFEEDVDEFLRAIGEY